MLKVIKLMKTFPSNLTRRTVCPWQPQTASSRLPTLVGRHKLPLASGSWHYKSCRQDISKRKVHVISLLFFFFFWLWTITNFENQFTGQWRHNKNFKLMLRRLMSLFKFTQWDVLVPSDCCTNSAIQCSNACIDRTETRMQDITAKRRVLDSVY